MTNEAKEFYNDYMKTYRATHKEQLKKYNAKYWAKRAKEAKEKQKLEG